MPHSTARLVFTLFDEDVVGGGSPIGSSHKKIVELLPETRSKDAVSMIKGQVIENLKNSGRLADAIKVEVNPETGEEETVVDEDVVLQAITDLYSTGTTASIKMNSKPRKKDKGMQRNIGMAAGAMIAGPAGAAVGGILANMYEGEIRGRVEVGLKYTPIPEVDLKLKDRVRYEVKGGLPGIEWGELYERHVTEGAAEVQENGIPLLNPLLAGSDLEFCCFVTHDSTGCSCALYRSLERKLIVVSFRGTCEAVDLVTDASIAQLAWVQGEDVENPDTVKVHSGFRNSLNSISRRLKELMLAAVAPGEALSEYDVMVTGHSLGGALATCFTMDIAEYGMDAGRSLPQLEPSDAWWQSIATTFTGKKIQIGAPPPPPRPKSLKVYNFGSPRVGNEAFCKKFDSLVDEGRIDEAYRIVNDQDAVARFPRTVNALVLGNVGYDHCGPTVLITELEKQIAKDGSKRFSQTSLLWIEGQSDEAACPVRDGNARSDPLVSVLGYVCLTCPALTHRMHCTHDRNFQGSGSLLGDIQDAFKSESEDDSEESFNLSKFSNFKLGSLAEKVTGRLQQLSAEDLASVVGIDKTYTQRELKLFQSIVSGAGLSHHMEDAYYQGLGLAGGFGALVGQPLTPLVEVEKMSVADIEEAIRLSSNQPQA